MTNRWWTRMLNAYWVHQLLRPGHHVTSDITRERLMNTCWTCDRIWVWGAREPRRHAPPRNWKEQDGR